MEGYEYKIGRITYFQTELNWKNDRKIFNLFRKFGVLPDDTEVSAANLQEVLTKGDILGEFLGIILRPKKSLFYFLQSLKIWILRHIFRRPIPSPFVVADLAPNSLIGQIFNDFFLLNRPLSPCSSLVNLYISYIRSK